MDNRNQRPFKPVRFANFGSQDLGGIAGLGKKGLSMNMGMNKFGLRKRSITDTYLDVGFNEKVNKPRIDFETDEIIYRSLVGSPIEYLRGKEARD